ncbi:hypothetical protein Droror1_Dr00025386, partial [Drosera rotundifolia]
SKPQLLFIASRLQLRTAKLLFPIPQSSRHLRPQTPQSPPLLHSPITPVPPSSPHHTAAHSSLPHHTESQPQATAQSFVQPPTSPHINSFLISPQSPFLFSIRPQI